MIKVVSFHGAHGGLDGRLAVGLTALSAGELAALPEADALTGDELVVVVHAGVVKRVTLATLKAYVDADPV